ncbi:hypothetical protein PFICI_12963 [Pestalotiopsis fici W106-1]|uniref:Uncharacterized protein n=1 Tax=Pestalotiopsis fici (strain W106-1 / CGMCC3.15140) TaxID=1229662 RepID=W3WQD4_PESFW|nr:uncharacterized protein PFICI_12963 [Pestalotiopsis fici W106-1]ETS76019.1 hypothetical protein PFICI_12963 [Pestalotiopsis fici W106-1]
MASEEMEISTDLGFHTLTEDIDIDVEFAAQQDEDLELGDFNHTEDFQHFNSDNRDELMAENDDASYGMIDVDDMSYNETAAAANDYEIPIGDADVYSWQEADVSGIQEDEIFAEEIRDNDALEFQTGVETIATVVDNDGISTQAQLSTSETAPHDAISGVEHYEVTEAVANDEAAAAMDADADGIAEQDFEDTDESTAPEHTAEEPATGPTVEVLESRAQSPPVIESNGESGDKQSVGIDNNTEILQTEAAPEPQAAEDEQHHDNSEDAEEEIGYGHDEADRNIPEEGLEATTNLDRVSSEPKDTQVSRPADAYDEAPGDDDDYHTDENQLEDKSYDDAENLDDQESKLAGTHTPSPQNPADSPVPHNDEDGVEAASEGISQDMKEVASRHTMVVRYGETDYRLFANETDDDPSEYFFKDLSALELSLGDFLSEIRNVISEEVSPLDELVLHVDGLGLEFGETMASQILDAHTFGNIVSLYDSLVQNDATEETLDAPELYMYLMVRPNCLQRLIALQFQAASGRSLTDVAVYREASPEQEQDDTPEHSENHATTPEYAEEELYDHDEQSEDDSFAQDHAGTLETEQETEQETYIAESEETQASAQQEEDLEEPKEGSADNDADDVVDYDNLDLSPSQQGNSPFYSSPSIPMYCIGTLDCQCDTCWLQRVEDIFTFSSTNRHGQTNCFIRVGGTHSASAGLQDAFSGGNHSETTIQSMQVMSEANSCRYQDVPNNSTNEPSLAPVEASLNAPEVLTEVGDVTDAATVDQNRAPPSESTSATATLDGNLNDEIDYDENDLDDGRGDANNTELPLPLSPAKLMVPLDEEITWESENEDARTELPATSNPSEQVSTTPGKRTRSGSDAAAITDGRKDVKRQRS